MAINFIFIYLLSNLNLIYDNYTHIRGCRITNLPAFLTAFEGLMISDIITLFLPYFSL